MIKRINTLLFCTLTLLSVTTAQSIQLEWYKPTPFTIDGFFQADDRLATLASEPGPDDRFFIRTYSFDGDSLERFVLPDGFYPRQACYNVANQAFYVVGTKPNFTFAVLVKMFQDGTVEWTKSVSLASHPLILGNAVESQGDKVLLGYFVAGPTNGVGYVLYDTDGNQLYQSELALAPTSLHEPAHRMKFDHAGNVIVVATPTNFGWPVRMVKFDGFTGLILWTKPNLALPLYGTTDSNSDFVLDEENNIYFSGHINKLIKLSPDGDILYSMPIDDVSYKIVCSIAKRGDYILLIGCWKEIPNDEQLFSSGNYLAAVHAPTGAVKWEVYGTQENYVFFNGIWTADTVLYTGSLAKYTLPATVVNVFEPLGSSSPLAAWPNPSTTGEVWLDPEDLKGIVRVYNAMGQLVKETPSNGAPILLQLPFASGSYRAVLTTHDGQTRAVQLLR